MMLPANGRRLVRSDHVRLGTRGLTIDVPTSALDITIKGVATFYWVRDG